MSLKLIATKATIFIPVTITIFLCVGDVFAKPKPKTKAYPASCATVWEAVKTTVQEHYDVLNLNDQTQSGSFTTGSVWTGVRPIAFSLSGTGETCTVSVTGHFSGLIHNDKGDFFKRIEEGLKRGAVQASSGKPTPSAVSSPGVSTRKDTVPGPTLEAEEITPLATPPKGGDAQPTPKAEGTLSITSDPIGAEIFVDSVSYGRAPKIVTLNAGKHTVQLVMQGYRDWVFETSVDAGSIVNVTATLQQ